MSGDTHVYPVAIEHNTDGPDCWCEPRIEIDVDADGNEVSRIIIHRCPPDSDDEGMQ
jgi:hypothetical protein